MLINSSATVFVSKNITASNLGTETIVLNLDSGGYYGLNDVGVTVWNLIQNPITLEEIRDALLAEYEVEYEQCDRDLRKLIAELSAIGLVEVSNETTN
ncbi:MAG: PqqD family protein [Cyanobacteria bacterium P01_A01_bin.83]